MIPMLRSAGAAGRPYVLLVDDEQVPSTYNFNSSPGHIVGIRTQQHKLGVYANWFKGSTRIDPSTIELEFYDYATEDGRSEIHSTPGNTQVPVLRDALLHDIITNELRGPIARRWRAAQHYSERAYLRYEAILNGLSSRDLSFGADF
jgi:uncharacterized sulfatase